MRNSNPVFPMLAGALLAGAGLWAAARAKAAKAAPTASVPVAASPLVIWLGSSSAPGPSQYNSAPYRDARGNVFQDVSGIPTAADGSSFIP